jgi:prepilin-type N-terminal cleavage/methylation domain-containing protein
MNESRNRQAFDKFRHALANLESELATLADPSLSGTEPLSRRLKHTGNTPMPRRPGFTLTELSLSIVIIGLLTSLIFGGLKLVAYAKVRAMISAKDAQQSAVYGFLSKYGEYPGDFTEASVYWNNAGVVSGDGDGKIAFQNGAGVYEGYNAWQHLALASMLERDYVGAAAAAPSPAIPDTHVPSSVFGGGFFLDYGFGGHENNNTIVLGGPQPAGASLSVGGLLLPENARDADLKFDDGNPSSGSIRAIDGAGVVSGECVDAEGTADDPGDDGYALENETRACVLSFKIVSQ